MPTEVGGLPTHPLLVHAVVVLLPLCAALLVAAVLAGRVRERLGGALPLLAAACLALVPLTSEAGEALQARLAVPGQPADATIARHAALGDGLLPYAVALLVAALAVWARPRVAALRGRRAGAVLAVVGLVVAVAVVVQVVRVGDSGARAVWAGGAAPAPAVRVLS